MTTRLNASMQAACISLLLMLVPCVASSQEPKEPAAQQQPEKATNEPAAQQQPEKTPEAPADQKASSLITPPEQEKTPETPEQQQKAETPAETTSVQPQAPSATEAQTYEIKQGDTLWDISNAFYKDPFLWPFIWKANPEITNPDLIYAGNKLTIPSLAPLERAMEAPEGQAAEKAAPAEKQAPIKKEAAAPSTKPTPSAEAAAPEEAAPEAAAPAIPEEHPHLVIDKYAMLSAGYINDLEGVGSIIGSVESGKETYGYDDFLYVKFDNPETVNVGDKFLVYHVLDKVVHPRTGENYGRLNRGLGILQITAKDTPEVLTGRITLSFDEMEKGDLLAPYQEPSLVYQPTRKQEKDIAGYILEVADKRTINAQVDIVYLDKGSKDGVEPGDRFTVFADPEQKGFPRKVIGEVQVFLVKDHTSTAVVQQSRQDLERGDAIAYKK